MKRFLVLLIPILALLVLAVPAAAEEGQVNPPGNHTISQADYGKSSDAHSRVEDRKAVSENEEANSEDEDVDPENENVSENHGQNGAQRLQFYTVTDVSSNNVTDTEVDGSVSVVAPDGDVALVIQGNIKSGLEANTDYEVWVRSLAGYTGPADKSYTPLNYYMLGTFTTNGEGHGQFHINILSKDLPAGTYEIQVAINPVPAEGAPEKTVVATSWPGLEVIVGSEG